MAAEAGIMLGRSLGAQVANHDVYANVIQKLNKDIDNLLTQFSVCFLLLKYRPQLTHLFRQAHWFESKDSLN